jgi:Zn finger protein HypA/HybF involved in hydrogenase expression
MHEAALAHAVAVRLTELAARGERTSGVTVHVRGSHGEPRHVRDSLAAHLEAFLGPQVASGLRIVSDPTPRLCVGCADLFEAIESDVPCPACGGPGIAVPTPETIELVLGPEEPLGRGPDRPGDRAERPSVERATRPDAGLGLVASRSAAGTTTSPEA